MGKGEKVVAIVNWDAELARLAEESAKQEAGTGAGRFFSVRGGTLRFNDAPLPNNEMAVVIVDSCLENIFYEGAFDPDSPTAPACYAFGRDEQEMAPHEQAESKQAESCVECEHNQWGSAAQGRGKACRNRRRLALISAGTLDKNGQFTPFDNPKQFETAEVAYLAVPPTSINGFGSYVKQLAGSLHRPPQAVFTKISVVQDPKTQLKIVFEMLGAVPNELLGVVMKRHAAEREVIEFPYAKAKDLPPKSGRRGNAPRPASSFGSGSRRRAPKY